MRRSKVAAGLWTGVMSLFPHSLSTLNLLLLIFILSVQHLEQQWQNSENLHLSQRSPLLLLPLSRPPFKCGIILPPVVCGWYCKMEQKFYSFGRIKS